MVTTFQPVNRPVVFQGEIQFSSKPLHPVYVGVGVRVQTGPAGASYTRTYQGQTIQHVPAQIYFATQTLVCKNATGNPFTLSLPNFKIASYEVPGLTDPNYLGAVSLAQNPPAGGFPFYDSSQPDTSTNNPDGFSWLWPGSNNHAGGQGLETLLDYFVTLPCEYLPTGDNALPFPDQVVPGFGPNPAWWVQNYTRTSWDGSNYDKDRGDFINLGYCTFVFSQYQWQINWPSGSLNKDGSFGTLPLPHRFVGIGNNATLFTPNVWNYPPVSGGLAVGAVAPNGVNTQQQLEGVGPSQSAQEWETVPALQAVPTPGFWNSSDQFAANAPDGSVALVVPENNGAVSSPIPVPWTFTDDVGKVAAYQMTQWTVSGSTVNSGNWQDPSPYFGPPSLYTLLQGQLWNQSGSGGWPSMTGFNAHKVLGVKDALTPFMYKPTVRVRAVQGGSGLSGVTVVAHVPGGGPDISLVTDTNGYAWFYPENGSPNPGISYLKPSGTVSDDILNLSAFGPFDGPSPLQRGSGLIYTAPHWNVPTTGSTRVQNALRLNPLGKTLKDLGFPASGQLIALQNFAPLDDNDTVTASFSGTDSGSPVLTGLAYVSSNTGVSNLQGTQFVPGGQVGAVNGTEAVFTATSSSGGTKYTGTVKAQLWEDGIDDLILTLTATATGSGLDVYQAHNPPRDPYITELSGTNVYQFESVNLDQSFNQQSCFTVGGMDQNLSCSRLILGTNRHYLVRDTGGTLAARDSFDAGRTWAASDTSLWTGLAPRLLQGTTGRIYLFYLTGASAPYDLRFRASSDLAQTWESEQVPLPGNAGQPDQPSILYDGVTWLLALATASGVEVWWETSLEAISNSAPGIVIFGDRAPWLTKDPLGQTLLFSVSGSAPNYQVNCRRLHAPVGGSPTADAPVTALSPMATLAYCAWQSGQKATVATVGNAPSLIYSHSNDSGQTWAAGSS